MVATEPLKPVVGTPQAITFKPDPRVALGQQIALGFIGLVIAMAAHYFKTRENFLKSAAFGLAGGIGITAFLILRQRQKGYAALTLGGESVTIQDNNSRVALPWNEITKVILFHHGEQRWEFHLEGHKEPFKYLLYGFLPPQLNEIQSAMRLRVSCWEERTPMEGPRRLA